MERGCQVKKKNTKLDNDKQANLDNNKQANLVLQSSHFMHTHMQPLSAAM